MPLTNAEVDAAVPAAGTPNRALTNAALKEVITDIAAAQTAASDRANHTGTQLAATVSDFAATVRTTVLTGYAAAAAAALAAGDTVLGAFNKLGGLLALLDGGTTGQVLKKTSNTDFDFGWAADATGGSGGTVRIATGTTDTLAGTDDGDTVVYTNAGAITVTIPEGLALTTGITLQWPAGTGTITLDPTGATTLNGSTSSIVLSQAAGMVALTPTGTDAYNVVGAIGDLVAADITDSTSAGRTLLTAADAAAQRTALSAAATSQSWGLSVTVLGTVANGDITLYLKVPAALNGATITEAVSKCVSGTATATLKINTTALGGTANSVSSTEQAQAHASANTLATGDDIVVTISGGSGLTSPTFSVSGTRTLS